MPRNILVAEDDDQVRQVIRLALERAGYDVCEAADGEEARRALGTAPFDLVITDIVMPGKDGLETIMFLRRNHPGTPVIAISGHDSPLFLSNAAGLGATHVLAKPFAPSQLLDLVDRVLAEAPAKRTAEVREAHP